MITTLNRATRRLLSRIDRHAAGVRAQLPAAIQPILQNGLLVRAFQDALVNEFLFPATAGLHPWSGALGDTATFTRTGLLAAQTTAITGSDASTGTYGVEQFSATMDQYGFGMDTNMLGSAMAISSKFLRDAQTLAINAGQSVNQISRNRLYGAYRGGNTFAHAASTTSATLVVDDATGFDTVLVNGVPTAVSGTNPMNVVINGVANTVTGCVLATNTLTLGTTISAVIGWSVISKVAPVMYRPGGKASAWALGAGDVATFSLFRSAVARLRTQNVPTIGGHYVAHIDPTTESELFSDSEFQALYRGRADSPVFQDLSIGRFGGIDWVRNNAAETKAVAETSITVHRPIVLGADALVATPFAEMGSLLSQVEGPTGYIEMVSPAPGIDVAYIVRPPQDRLQQVVGQAWSWVGDFAVPSDSVSESGSVASGDTARFKRAVVVEHA